MKRITILLLLFSINLFSQSVGKKEFLNIVKEIRIANKKNSFTQTVLIADNTDSIFYESEKVKLYTNIYSPRKNNLCRTLKFDFVDRKHVSFQDCQSCKEPSSCYIVTDRTFYKYKLFEKNDELYLQLQNLFGKRIYKIDSCLRDVNNKILEINLIRS